MREGASGSCELHGPCTLRTATNSTFFFPPTTEVERRREKQKAARNFHFVDPEHGLT